jgi:hypothetical protein
VFWGFQNAYEKSKNKKMATAQDKTENHNIVWYLFQRKRQPANATAGKKLTNCCRPKAGKKAYKFTAGNFLLSSLQMISGPFS